ncbi:MAG: BACON domain-containing protein [Prevotellaceae bacterium]|nr:BACON domain-containing protein [Prevotellaceae bacterium]
MKTLRTLFGLFAATLALVSCKEAASEFHTVYFLPQGTGGFTLYADQTETDTVGIFSTDSWSLAISDSWLTATPTAKTVSRIEDYATTLHLTLDVNATGKTRQTPLRATTTEFSEVSFLVYQVPYLHITKPGYNPHANDGQPFVLPLPAQGAQATIAFYVYQDGATLTTNDDWLAALVRTALTPNSEDDRNALLHEISADIPDNSSAQERRGTLRLTSGGVSTDIIVVQSGRSNENRQ